MMTMIRSFRLFTDVTIEPDICYFSERGTLEQHLSWFVIVRRRAWDLQACLE